jgi:hypothetical protein
VRVRRLLSRLEFIFNLPAKLTASVEKGDYEAAVIIIIIIIMISIIIIIKRWWW